MFPIPLRKVVLQLSLLIVTLAVDTHYLFQIQKVDRKVSINTLNILFFLHRFPSEKSEEIILSLLEPLIIVLL